MAKHKTIIVTRDEDVPAGFVRLNSLHKLNSPAYNSICYARKLGVIQAYKVVRTMGDFKKGPLYVLPEEVTQYLDSRAEIVAAKKSMPTKAVAEPVVPSIGTPALMATIDDLTDVMRQVVVKAHELKVALELRQERELYGTES